MEGVLPLLTLLLVVVALTKLRTLPVLRVASILLALPRVPETVRWSASSFAPAPVSTTATVLTRLAFVAVAGRVSCG